MRYSGSKYKVVNELIPIITKHLKDDMWYIEPFVGGCNVFSKIDHRNKLGADNNKYVIDMWLAFQNGQEPIRNITKDMYLEMKDIAVNGHKGLLSYPNWLIGYTGNSCSYGSAWFNGYAGGTNKRNEDHIGEAYNNIMKQLETFKFLKDSIFLCADYKSLTNWSNGERCVIYCDPPYANTKQYMHSFNSDEFWDWVRTMSKKGHYVYVSEYDAPSDFTCIWSKERKDGMKNTPVGVKQNTKVERLFVHESQA